LLLKGLPRRKSIVIIPEQSVGAETALVMNSTFGCLFVCGSPFLFYVCARKKGIVEAGDELYREQGMKNWLLCVACTV